MLYACKDVDEGRGGVGELPIEVIGKLPTWADERLLVCSVEKLQPLTVEMLPIYYIGGWPL